MSRPNKSSTEFTAHFHPFWNYLFSATFRTGAFPSHQGPNNPRNNGKNHVTSSGSAGWVKRPVTLIRSSGDPMVINKSSAKRVMSGSGL